MACTVFAKTNDGRGIRRGGLTRRYESAEDAQQTRGPPIRKLQALPQRPPLAMFDPSLIHRNDEIFNPEPNRLGIFFASIPPAILYLSARVGSKSSRQFRLPFRPPGLR